MYLNDSKRIYCALIDYKKAFDTISMNCLKDSINSFGFGTVFQKWIEIILNNRTACVKNGGHVSRDFSMERGVRQGCPISPILFIMAVELFAINIRQNTKIKGVTLPNSTFTYKILQYADDTTLFLRDLIDFREVLSKIKEFSLVSGLCINVSKTKAICPGQSMRYGDRQLDIEFVGEIKILGVHFSVNISAAENDQNWNSKIEALEKILKRWSRRDLSLIGKIQIIKTFGVSQFTYIMQSIGLPERAQTKITRIFFKFLWLKQFSNKRAIEKVRRSYMYSDYPSGGLNMHNIFESQTAFLLQWAEKLLVGPEEKWKVLPRFFLADVGSHNVFQSSVPWQTFKGRTLIRSAFWSNVVEAWLSKNCNYSYNSSVFNEPIFNNANVQYNNRPIFLNNVIRNNIFYVRDMCVGRNPLSFDQFKNKCTVYPVTFIDYFIIHSALPRDRLSSDDQNYEDEVRFKGAPIGTLGHKGFRGLIKKAEINQAFNRWSTTFSVSVPETIWGIAAECTAEVRLKLLHWKIINNIYGTNILLKKMGVRDTENCAHCNVPDYIEHFFVECNKVKGLWTEVENKLASVLGFRLTIPNHAKLLGFTDLKAVNKDAIRLINHIILIGKMCISKFKYGRHYNLIYLFESECQIRNMF